jgi:sugar phosphate isomerase/epimerase
MPRTCTVCRHAQREQIDAALLSGRSTFRGLASSYGVSASAVRRHRAEHLPEVLRRAKSLDDIAAAVSLAEQVRTLRAHAVQLLAKFQAEGDSKNELAVLRELRALADVEARGADRDGAVIHVSIVQQYVSNVIQVLREFVPLDRLDIVIAKLEATLPTEHR